MNPLRPNTQMLASSIWTKQTSHWTISPSPFLFIHIYWYHAYPASFYPWFCQRLKKIWKILCFSSDDQLSMNSLFRRVTDNVSLRKTNNTELRWNSHGSMFLHSCESQMSLLWSILVGKNDKWIHIDYSFKITCLKMYSIMLNIRQLIIH